MANEVELITFANKTVSPVYDAIIQELYTDGGGVITGCTVTIKDANHLHITEGYGVLCGREFKIVASDIPVQLSSSGNLNGRLYLHMDLSLATDPITLLVETGSTLTPVQQDANVNTTNGVYEINLATFTVGTSAISNLQDVAPKAIKIPDALSSLNSALDTKANVALTYSTGTVNIAASTYTTVDIPFTNIPSTSKCLTPYFASYPDSSLLSMTFRIIRTNNAWRIAVYNTATRAVSVGITVDYIPV